MMMPGRKYDAGSGYRYGFNGKEDDEEVDWQDYGMRIYAPRLGKFLSVDPLSKKYPFYSPYQFAANSVIATVDIDGLEPGPVGYSNTANTLNKGFIWKRASNYEKYDYPAYAGHTGKNTLLYVVDANNIAFWVVRHQYDQVFEGKIYPKTDYYYFTKPPSENSDTYKNGVWEYFEAQERTDAKSGSSFSSGFANGVFQGTLVTAYAATGVNLYQGMPGEEPGSGPQYDPTPQRNFLTTTQFGTLAQDGLTDPNNIRFSQNSISEDFGDGQKVGDMIKELKNGSLKPEDVKAIRLVEKDGKIYSLDNRRLYAFQKAGVKIKYTKVTYNPKNHFKYFSTRNNGESIRVRSKTTRQTLFPKK